MRIHVPPATNETSLIHGNEFLKSNVGTGEGDKFCMECPIKCNKTKIPIIILTPKTIQLILTISFTLLVFQIPDSI